jgi:plastocyanin
VTPTSTDTDIAGTTPTDTDTADIAGTTDIAGTQADPVGAFAAAGAAGAAGAVGATGATSRTQAEPVSPARAVPAAEAGRARRRGWRRAVGLAVEAGAYVWATQPDPPAPLGPGEVTVELRIEHSLFDVQRFRVYEGTRVRFVLDNGDPIGHELIVGGPEVHARHAAGTHPRHAPIPGEVSVTPNDRAVTTFRFDDPGSVEFACHLPGHYEYGMHGTIEVVPRA